MTTPRFSASILFGHQVVLSNVMGRVQLGQVFSLTPDEHRQLSDLAGALNYWAAQMPITNVVVTQEFREGDPRFVFTCSADYVTAVPFNIRPGPYTQPVFRGTGAEYQSGGTAMWKAAINRVAGDMTGAIGGSSVLEVARNAETDGDGLWYYNCRLDPGSQDRGTGFSVYWPVWA